MVRPPAKAPKERRRSERFAVNEIVRNESRGTPVALGRLKDVSLGDAYLETSRRSQRTGPLKLRLTSVDVGADELCWIQADITHGDRRGVGLQWQILFAAPGRRLACVEQLRQIGWRPRLYAHVGACPPSPVESELISRCGNDFRLDSTMEAT